ncbi:MAG TPA: hypothetical protein VH143_17165 [Kofleriaceae bacterium]|jgi:hypothetical protein|nr:hypothetical protein [Kofleriaceae bacterium]
MNRLLISCLVVLAACGDNKKSLAPDGGGSNVAPIDAPSTPHAIVVAPSADFVTPPGIMSELDVDSQHVTQNLFAGAVGADPFLRNYGGMLFVINRDGGDNITIVDAHTLAFVNQIATGTSSNPQDVAVIGDKVYVPALGTAGVVVLSQSAGAMTSTIDLSGSDAANDPDGKPDCVSAFAIGTDVYVACDVYDETTFVPAAHGMIVVIDSTTDTVRTAVQMPVPNPQNEFVQLPDQDLMISAEPLDSGSDEMKGCIVRVTPGTTPAAVCQIENTDINGIVDAMALKPAPNPLLWISVEAFDFSGASLSTWNVLNANDLTNNISPPTEMITDVTVCPDNTVIAADQTAALNGLRIYNGTTEVTTMPLPIGLPPGDGDGMVCYDP